MDIAGAFKALNEALEEKEKALDEKEKEFEKKVKLFEQANPENGSPSDVLELNVGGDTSIAVLRRTLTHFEDSMLASKFSGRWDDSLEKDSSGRIFIDQDPFVFLRLLTYLRLLINHKEPGYNTVEPPKPSFSFCTMCHYYDLMPALYPLQYEAKYGSLTSVERTYSSIVLHADSLTSVMLSTKGNLPIIAYDVRVLKNSASAHIGYADNLLSEKVIGIHERSVALDVENRKVMNCGRTAKADIDFDINKEDISISCSRMNDSISIKTGTLQHLCTQSRYNHPVICFRGRVIVSGIKYEFPKQQFYTTDGKYY